MNALAHRLLKRLARDVQLRGGAMKTEIVSIEALLTVQEVAALIKASRSWVYKAAEAGTLPCVRIGALLRFDPRAIRAWLAGERPGAKSVKLPGCRAG